jgi:hypothetical protein
MRRSIATLGALVALAILGSSAPAAALAGPFYNLDIHHNETNFPPGGTAQYWFDVANVGDAPTSGTVSLLINLPSGVTGSSITNLNPTVGGSPWNCPGVAGASTISCTTAGPIERHALNRALILHVAIAAGASGDRFATAKVEGGGAAARSAFELTHIDSTPAPFGIVADSFTPDFVGADGLTTVRASGAHPDLAVFPFDFNSISAPAPGKPNQKAESESIRDLQVDLPPGFLGNPTTVGECTPAQLSFAACPPSSQVGRVDLAVYPVAAEPFAVVSAGVFNMVHPRGSVTDLAFTFTGIPVHIKAALDPANRYAIKTVVSDINESVPPFNQKLTVWGVPAAPSHDSERCHNPEDERLDTSSLCPTDQPEKPFLTVPFQCEVDNAMRLHHYDSWQHTGAFGPDLKYPMPGQTVECDKPRFVPDVEIEPTGRQANTPTGLNVHIQVAQNDNPSAPATPPVKRVAVTLPRGMSFSPSFADGLQSCSLVQMNLGTDEPVGCPDASRIGEVSLLSPLLPKPIEGSMYLAAQGDNPFGSLFALYLVVHDTEERGVLVKIPGKIDVDQVTGQITTTFDDAPQFPFEDLTLKFRSGSRAPLVNPPTCGTQTIGVQVSSYAQPQDPVDVSNTFEVSEGPNGTACPGGAALRPFGPRLHAGTANPSAGDYSPFSFQLERDDSEQELSRVTTILPPGLVAKIAGIPFCPESAIASISSAEGTAVAETEHPACPAASRIGTLSAGLGAGPGPNYFPGSVYLAGPYKGAPLSLAVVAPGLAGPFDLGSVVVRAALFVDPSTTQVRAVSDSFPSILHGVILRVRDVRLAVDRAQTTLNPTNCSRFAVGADVAGVGGDLLGAQDDSLFHTSVPFQVGDCASLRFAPKLSFRLHGGTRRGAHPKLRATLKMPAGGANIAAASVALPASEFLDQSHIGTVCTRVQFAAEQCPSASVYGTASARTPLLDEALTGKVYLRSSSHLLPDLVAALRGKIDVNVVGRVDSKNGGIRNTFEVVPDAPVESFTLALAGGKKGLLVNSTNLCRGRHRATAKFTGQNGKTSLTRPPLKANCRAKSGKRPAARH